MTVAITVTARTNCMRNFLITNYDTHRRHFLGRTISWRTPKLSDAGGSDGAVWQRLTPARIRSSDLVRLWNHGIAGKIMEQTRPTKALSKQTDAKRGAPRRSNHHKTTRPIKENTPVTPAASLSGESFRGSTVQSVKTDITDKMSNSPMRMLKSVRCDAMTSDFMEPNVFLSDRLRQCKPERERHVRIASRHRAQKRGGGSPAGNC